MGMMWLKVRFSGDTGEESWYKLPEYDAKEYFNYLCKGYLFDFQYGEKRVFINPTRVCTAYLEPEEEE